MKVCILSDQRSEDFNPHNFLAGFDWALESVQFPIREFIHSVSSSGKYDVFLNLYDGYEYDDSAYEMVEILEQLNLPFTGGGSNFFDPTREHMQMVAERNGIDFVRGFRASNLNDLSHARDLNYPLMVKHPNSYASTAMTRDSRVDSEIQLEEQFKRIAAEFGAARVEEFIEGREVTCLVVDNPDDLSDPFAYPPAEIVFPQGETFLHEDTKWVDGDTRITPLKDLELVRYVQRTSCRLYLALHGTGYARLDLRVGPEKNLVVLEINPNPGILYPLEEQGHADLPISWDADGHYGFFDRIFRSAIVRQHLRAKEIDGQ